MLLVSSHGRMALGETLSTCLSLSTWNKERKCVEEFGLVGHLSVTVRKTEGLFGLTLSDQGRMVNGLCCFGHGSDVTVGAFGEKTAHPTVPGKPRGIRVGDMESVTIASAKAGLSDLTSSHVLRPPGWHLSIEPGAADEAFVAVVPVCVAQAMTQRIAELAQH